MYLVCEVDHRAYRVPGLVEARSAKMNYGHYILTTDVDLEQESQRIPRQTL